MGEEKVEALSIRRVSNGFVVTVNDFADCCGVRGREFVCSSPTGLGELVRTLVLLGPGKVQEEYENGNLSAC